MPYLVTPLMEKSTVTNTKYLAIGFLLLFKKMWDFFVKAANTLSDMVFGDELLEPQALRLMEIVAAIVGVIAAFWSINFVCGGLSHYPPIILLIEMTVFSFILGFAIFLLAVRVVMWLISKSMNLGKEHYKGKR